MKKYKRVFTIVIDSLATLGSDHLTNRYEKGWRGVGIEE